MWITSSTIAPLQTFYLHFTLVSGRHQMHPRSWKPLYGYSKWFLSVETAFLAKECMCSIQQKQSEISSKECGFMFVQHYCSSNASPALYTGIYRSHQTHHVGVFHLYKRGYIYHWARNVGLCPMSVHHQCSSTFYTHFFLWCAWKPPNACFIRLGLGNYMLLYSGCFLSEGSFWFWQVWKLLRAILSASLITR